MLKTGVGVRLKTGVEVGARKPGHCNAHGMYGCRRMNGATAQDGKDLGCRRCCYGMHGSSGAPNEMVLQ